MSTEPRRGRKYYARAERERQQRRLLIGGVIALVLIVAGVLGYGWYDTNVRRPQQPVITVNGESVSQAEFQSRARLRQRQLLSRFQSAQQLMTMFPDNEQTQSTLQSQLDQIQAELSNPAVTGQQVIEQMIGDLLIRQEAERRGISVSDAEVQELIQESFGYYPQGTPTPAPSPTPNATALAALPPTPTPTEGPTPTATIQPPTPAATPTVMTEGMFEQQYDDFIAQLEEDGVRAEDYRSLVRNDLLRQELMDAFREETPRVQDQVHARHILVEEEETAEEVLAALEAGEDWEELAAEYSTDQSNANQGGDLGWFSRGRMVEPFDEAAFSAEVGEIVGPVQSEFGYHIIEVLDRSERELEGQAFEQAVQQRFSTWLNEARSESEVNVSAGWIQLVPTLAAPPAAAGP